MGLTEILRHLPRLVALRRRLRDALLALEPDVFVGIDAPEFNLGLARQLKQRGLRTVQYVSPQVWAWRQGRVRTIGRAIDLVLCLLPFEPRFYADHGVRALFVGHPLADRFPLEPDRAGARQELGLAPEATVLAVLPGSRLGEVTRLGADFAAAAAWLAARVPGLQIVAPMASARVRERFGELLRQAAPTLAVRCLDGQSRLALAAADVVLVASGTATLETLLSKRPMVVAYRVGATTAFLLRHLGLLKVEHIAQPNCWSASASCPSSCRRRCSPPRSVRRCSSSCRPRAATIRCRAVSRGARVAAPGRRGACGRGDPRTRRGRRSAARRCGVSAPGRRRGAAAASLPEPAMPWPREPWLAGVDEAGRGPLAGPVVAAAVMLDPARPITGLADSKQLEPGERTILATQVREFAQCWAIGVADAAEIDALNILGATLLAMRRALLGLALAPRAVVVDGNRLPRLDDLSCGADARAIVRGDALHPAISAASILAKTWRDTLMEQLDTRFPGFGFAIHKGYPTPQHLAALRRLGPSPVHRRSFGPVKSSASVP